MEQIVRFQFKNETGETMSDEIALVVTGLPEGVELLNKDDDSPYGPYVVLDVSEYGQCTLKNNKKQLVKLKKLNLCSYIEHSHWLKSEVIHKLIADDYSSPISLRFSKPKTNNDKSYLRNWGTWKNNEDFDLIISILPKSFIK